MMRVFVLSAVMVLLLPGAKAQDHEWQLLFSVHIEQLDQISLDNRENVFYADDRGNVVKINAHGERTSRYANLFQTQLSQLEALWTVNIFLFSSDLQQYTLLDRFLNPLISQDLPQEGLGIIKGATLGNNNVLWLYDEVNLSLVQYDYQRNLILQNQSLSLMVDRGKIGFRALQERQNKVFMHFEDQGIFIFDNQGNFLKKINRSIKYRMSIYEDDIYFMENGFIHRLNIYSEEEERVRSPDPSYQNIGVTANRMVFYSSGRIDVYKRLIFE